MASIEHLVIERIPQSIGILHEFYEHMGTWKLQIRYRNTLGSIEVVTGTLQMLSTNSSGSIGITWDPSQYLVTVELQMPYGNICKITLELMDTFGNREAANALWE